MTPPSHRLLSRLLIAGTLAAGALPATAGAPLLRETCIGPDRRPVPTRYDPGGTRYFAEARWMGNQAVIVVNPEVYFLGQSTQQWLYFRQCVHIQRQHPIVRDGERALNPEQEELADCEALREMDRLPGAGQSTRTLRMSIESDMERLLRSDQWRRVLAGPQRRIVFDRCPA